jgi:hypothetical protein
MGRHFGVDEDSFAHKYSNAPREASYDRPGLTAVGKSKAAPKSRRNETCLTGAIAFRRIPKPAQIG